MFDFDQLESFPNLSPNKIDGDVDTFRIEANNSLVLDKFVTLGAKAYSYTCGEGQDYKTLKSFIKSASKTQKMIKIKFVWTMS